MKIPLHFAEMLGLICFSQENKNIFINIFIECINKNEQKTKFGQLKIHFKLNYYSKSHCFLPKRI
jgi:hypothetical protein